jgi:hypothetical protein
MSWWDLGHIEKQKQNDELQSVVQVNYDKIVCQKTNDLVSIIGNNLEPSTQYRVVTDKSFNAIVVLNYIIARYKIQEIYIAIYRMNLPAVHTLKNIIQSQGLTGYMVLSNFFRENKKYERWAEDIHLFSKSYPNFKLSYGVNHAKVFCCQTECGKHIVFEGSGNLSDNARIEQYLLEDNKTTFDFHSGWIKQFCDKND